MHVIVFTLTLLAFSADAEYEIRPFDSPGGRIVGGQDTTIEQNAHQLSLEKNSRFICGATILSPTRALTAASCTHGSDPSTLAVRAGSGHPGVGGQVVSVLSFSPHPKYDPNHSDYDVCVLALGTSLEFGPGVQKITLHEAGRELADGVVCTVSGWGDTPEDPSSAVLQIVEVPKFSNSRCKELYGRDAITERMTCHGYGESGKNACVGKPGGPLIAGGKQVGIASWAKTCEDEKFPGVYTKIANEEIHEHILNSL